jgi:hypothetical protein
MLAECFCRLFWMSGFAPQQRIKVEGSVKNHHAQDQAHPEGGFAMCRSNMKRLIWAVIAIQALAATTAEASVATNANSLLGGVTTYNLRDYENVYDSTGALVTSGVIQPGDTIQGVFVINQVINQYGPTGYSPTAGGVELTGAFDEYVSGYDGAGNYILMPDSTSVTSGGSSGKAMSGTAFQSAYGNGAMFAIFQNNNDAMPVQMNGNGLVGLTTAQALALATTGSKWATFGQNGLWGAGYYWTAQQATFGSGAFAASLGMIQNNTGISLSQFQPLAQSLPAGVNSDPGLSGIANYLVIEGTLSPSNNNLSGTPYTVFSSDPMQIDPLPEPSGVVVVGGLFGLWAIGTAAYRRMRKAAKS